MYLTEAKLNRIRIVWSLKVNFAFEISKVTILVSHRKRNFVVIQFCLFDATQINKGKIDETLKHGGCCEFCAVLTLTKTTYENKRTVHSCADIFSTFLSLFVYFCVVPVSNDALWVRQRTRLFCASLRSHQNSYILIFFFHTRTPYSMPIELVSVDEKYEPASACQYDHESVQRTHSRPWNNVP